jgi:hypothetical protein
VSKQTKFLLSIGVIAALVVGWQMVAFAALSGSNFEIDPDANLKLDGAPPLIDWGIVTEIRKADTTSGPTDESFGQGAKEDSAVPSVVDGSIPPNKSDLKFFGVYQEGGTTNGFLNLYWSRVQEPQGTTNMDFEFNQSSVPSSNGTTPVRTAGDLLIIYDLSQGGTNPTLSIRTWNGSSWGPATDLTASTKATGSINTATIPDADSDGLGAHSPRTFGEAQIALSSIFTDPNVCKSFGSAYLKSRSSDSFTAALKDFVPPVPVNISNCGSVEITKTDDASPANPLKGAVFEAYKDNPTVGGTRGNEDTATGKTCTTGDDGKCTILNLLAGEYWIVETTTPAGYDTAADQHATITADSKVTLTFVDPAQLGALKILKQSTKTGNPLVKKAGAVFTYDNDTTDQTPAVEVTDRGPNDPAGADQDNDIGEVCVSGLKTGDYKVNEKTPPPDYGAASASQANQSVTVAPNTDCDSTTTDKPDPGAGATATFTNPPLADIQINFRDGGSGETKLGTGGISCTGQTEDSTTPPSGWSDSKTFEDLPPGTYNCTVVVDP